MSSKINLKRMIGKSGIFLFVAILLIIIFGIKIGSTTSTKASISKSPPTSLFESIPTSKAIDWGNSKLTEGWANMSDDRNYTYKIPSSWDDLDHCIKPQDPKSFSLSPTCVKVVIFTDSIPPDDESGNGRKLELVSKTKTKIDGYLALRKIYTIPGEENTPDTYQLWLYDNNKPFMLILVWIGEGTDSQTANNLVNVMDRVASTLQLHRNK